MDEGGSLMSNTKKSNIKFCTDLYLTLFIVLRAQQVSTYSTKKSLKTEQVIFENLR